MNKKILSSSIIIFILSITVATAQVVQKFGANSFTINSKAVLELESTTKGFLPPRMTVAQQSTMTANFGTVKPTGLIIYVTDFTPGTSTPGLKIYDGTAWTNVADAADLAAEVARAQAAEAANTILIGLKEASANKKSDFTAIDDGNGIDYFPTINAVVNYVAEKVSVNNIVTKTADYTTLATDYTIVFNLATPATLTLPSAAPSNNGRVFVISKNDTTDNILTIYPNIFLSSTELNPSALNYPKIIRIQSDGTRWNIID